MQKRVYSGWPSSMSSSISLPAAASDEASAPASRSCRACHIPATSSISRNSAVNSPIVNSTQRVMPPRRRFVQVAQVRVACGWTIIGVPSCRQSKRFFQCSSRITTVELTLRVRKSITRSVMATV